MTVFVFTIGAINKDIKRTKKNFADNQGHNKMRCFDISPNFLLSTSEMKRDFSNKRGKYEFPHKLPNDLKLENIRKICKFHRIIAYWPVLISK